MNAYLTKDVCFKNLDGSLIELKKDRSIYIQVELEEAIAYVPELDTHFDIDKSEYRYFV